MIKKVDGGVAIAEARTMVAEQCGRRLAQAYTRRARARLPLPEQTPAALIETCVIASRGAQAENEIQLSRI